MTRQVALLRGINVGGHKRIAMAELRKLLAQAGFSEVYTYLQSGNVVLASEMAPEPLARECERLIAGWFGFEVAVIARTRDELADVVRKNPLAEVASDPKRYQVSFLAAEPDPQIVDSLIAVAAPGERLVADGRELYAWHPDGIGRSRLSEKLAGGGLGVSATARNWATVTSLLTMADGR